MAEQLLRHNDDDEDDEVVTLSSKRIDVDFNGGGSGGGKAARLPRWTRQEILVLIQGKRVAENRVRRGRGAALLGDNEGQGQQVEPKWATVSSYCKRHGVNRGAVQCRKRWSNLAGDFKKIKEWEAQVKDESDSFWLMRNDLRREKKLPGFFDREVFDILSASPQQQQQQQPDAVFDSGRTAAADDGLFSDFEQHQQQQQVDVDNQIKVESPPHQHLPNPNNTTIPAPTPISEKQYQPKTAEVTGPTGSNHEKQRDGLDNFEIGSTSREGRKRRRVMEEDDNNGEDELIQVLERNGKILNAQLDAYNINLKLDRDERKNHATSLVAVLNKLADSLGKIADKL